MLTPHGRGHGLAHPMVDHGKSPTNPLKSAIKISISTIQSSFISHFPWKTLENHVSTIHMYPPTWGPTPQALHREGHLKANQEDLPRGAAQQAQQEGGSKEPQPTKHGDDWPTILACQHMSTNNLMEFEGQTAGILQPKRRPLTLKSVIIPIKAHRKLPKISKNGFCTLLSEND